MKNEKIEYLRTEQLVPFRNHPFRLRDGAEKENLKDSLRKQGTIEPLVVRPLSDGRYEVVSGHRRLEAGKELGIEALPVIVRDLSDTEAVCMMADANLHRERLLPSEKAFAYRMKLEAVSRGGQAGHRSRDGIADNESGRQVQRYIRLTHLIPELLKKVDDGEIAFTPAVELSYLTEPEQQDLLSEMEYADCTPSLSQAQRLRAFSREGRLTPDVCRAVMSEEKPNQKEQIRFRTEDLRKYFPRSYTEKDIHDDILKLLDIRQKKRERQGEAR